MKKEPRFKRKSWEFYDAWRKTQSYSPALKGNVRISLLGWRHISGATGHKKRTLKDIYRRLKLLPYAKQIIETSTTIQNISRKSKKVFYALEAVVMIKEKSEKDLRKVRVVLVEDKQKNKKVERLTLRLMSLSVMESKNSLVPHRCYTTHFYK